MTPTWRSAFLKLLSVALAITAVVLTVRIAAALDEGESRVLDAGEHATLQGRAYADEHTVLLPEHQVRIRVAEPLTSLDGELIDNGHSNLGQTWQAPDGGSLVPASWRMTDRGGRGYPQKGPTPIQIRLVVGDEKIPVAAADWETYSEAYDSYAGVAQVFAVAGDVDLEDITVEIESEGVTQVLHPTTGKIDAGIAQPLYEPAVSFDAGCSRHHDCEMEIEGPSDSLRTFSADVSLDPVSEVAHEAELGWADEGSRWVIVDLNLSHGYGMTPDGDTLEPTSYGTLEVSLDGVEPIDRSRLEHAAFWTKGRVVFELEQGTVPKSLHLRQIYTFGGAVGKVTVTRQVKLRPTR